MNDEPMNSEWKKTNDEPATTNWFVEVQNPKPPTYGSKGEYLKAMGEQLTPDLWAAIVARAIHDATFGKNSVRTSAREWLGKHVLPYRPEVELLQPEQSRFNSMGEVMVEMFNILTSLQYRHFGANDKKDAALKGLAITIGKMEPEERSMLRDAVTQSESVEVQEWLRTENAMIEANTPASL